MTRLQTLLNQKSVDFSQVQTALAECQAYTTFFGTRMVRRIDGKNTEVIALDTLAQKVLAAGQKAKDKPSHTILDTLGKAYKTTDGEIARSFFLIRLLVWIKEHLFSTPRSKIEGEEGDKNFPLETPQAPATHTPSKPIPTNLSYEKDDEAGKALATLLGFTDQSRVVVGQWVSGGVVTQHPSGLLSNPLYAQSLDGSFISSLHVFFTLARRDFNEKEPEYKLFNEILTSQPDRMLSIEKTDKGYTMRLDPIDSDPLKQTADILARQLGFTEKSFVGHATYTLDKAGQITGQVVSHPSELFLSLLRSKLASTEARSISFHDLFNHAESMSSFDHLQKEFFSGLKSRPNGHINLPNKAAAPKKTYDLLDESVDDL